MTLATLNGGVAVTSCRLQIPAYGCWWADVECASQDELSGAVTLALDDLQLRGTIVSGGAYQVRTRYRIVGGAGGWGRRVAARSYANDAGVKASLVLADVAREVGETLGPLPPGTLGPAFVRAAEPASRVLDAVSPRAWYVDAQGVTQLGRRPTRTFTGAYAPLTNDAARARVDIAPGDGTLAALLPGVLFDGLGELVDVEHVLDGDTGKLRTSLWGRGSSETSRFPEAIRKLVAPFVAALRFSAQWEYRVVQVVGDRLDLQAPRVSSGMPDLLRVRVRPGVGGARVRPCLGSMVVVAFLNADQGRPEVVGFDAQDAPGFVPTEIALMAGATGSAPTEHATSAEAMLATVQQAIYAIGTALGAPGSAVTALATDAGFAGLVATCADADIGPLTAAAIGAALASKGANTDGSKPSLGWPAVRGG